MRNRIFGAIGVLWGGFILFNAFSGRTAQGGNAAFRTGQYVAIGLGALLFTAGLYYLVQGGAGGPKKKKKKKRPSAIRTPPPL